VSGGAGRPEYFEVGDGEGASSKTTKDLFSDSSGGADYSNAVQLESVGCSVSFGGLVGGFMMCVWKE